MKNSVFPSWTIFGGSDELLHPRTNKPRSGHYKTLATQFRSDGCDDYTVQKFLRQELTDEIMYSQNLTSTDDDIDIEKREIIDGIAEWWTWNQDRRDFYLSNAYCSNCGGKTGFDSSSGYSIAGGGGKPVLLNGRCKACGSPIARICD